MAGTLSLLLLPAAFAAPRSDKDKKQEEVGQSVDSGSFGIFMNGKRVATETFSIQQDGKGSLVTSQFKSEQGMDQALQSSELQLNAEWRAPQVRVEGSPPGKDYGHGYTQRSVSDRAGHLRARGPSRSSQPFLLPASTSILDDYFFVHREVLLWKYLATGCHQDKGRLQCPMHERAQFGTLNPHSRSSAPATLEFSGREKDFGAGSGP